ncbi:unnamed protein product, partial [Prorocentrum cordatum]
ESEAEKGEGAGGAEDEEASTAAGAEEAAEAREGSAGEGCSEGRDRLSEEGQGEQRAEELPQEAPATAGAEKAPTSTPGASSEGSCAEQEEEQGEQRAEELPQEAPATAGAEKAPTSTPGASSEGSCAEQVSGGVLGAFFRPKGKRRPGQPKPRGASEPEAGGPEEPAEAAAPAAPSGAGFAATRDGLLRWRAAAAAEGAPPAELAGQIRINWCWLSRASNEADSTPCSQEQAPAAGEAALEAAASSGAALLARLEEGAFGAAPSPHASAPSAPPARAPGAVSDAARPRRERQAEEHAAGSASEPRSRRRSRRQAAEPRELRRTMVRPGPATVLEPRNPSWSSAPATAGAGDAGGPPSGAPGAGAAAAAAAAAEATVARSGAAQGAVASAKQPAAITSVCLVCLRGCTSEARLRGHEELSELHRRSVARLREGSVARPEVVSGTRGPPLRRGPPVRDAILGEKDNNGCTAAHWAAYKGDLRGLQLLDYFGADLQATDKMEMTPLHRATCASQSSVVEFLVEKRCDIGQRNGEQKSCMDIAADKQDVVLQAVFKRLMKKPSASTGKAAADVEQGGGANTEGETQKTGLIQTIMKDKAAHKMFPVFWLVCVSMATFEYLMDLRLTSYEVAPTASLLFELGAPLSLAIFAVVALKDPGRIMARAKGHSGVEELMKALDSNSETVPDLSRLCTTTWVMKDLRTKYCTQTGACVKEFDHYCVWLNTAIGRGNHREFVGLAVVEFCTQICFIYLSWCMALSLVPYTSIGSWLIGVIGGYPLLALIIVIQCLTAPWVLMLLLHQVRLVAMNLTTNEMMNMHRYGHFWTVQELAPGRRTKMFRNPFDKGSTLKNCMDFWWLRRRSDQAPASAQGACGGCAHGCHSHH